MVVEVSTEAVELGGLIMSRFAGGAQDTSALVFTSDAIARGKWRESCGGFLVAVLVLIMSAMAQYS